MIKNFFIIIVTTFFLNNCGYSPMYSKNFDKKFNIELVSFDGDREINNAIKYNFKRYNNNESGLKILIITSSSYTKSSGTKDLAGDTQSYNISATVNFKVSIGEIEKVYNFNEDSIINNLDSQLDEATNEKNIKKNFGILFSDRLIFELSKI